MAKKSTENTETADVNALVAVPGEPDVDSSSDKPAPPPFIGNLALNYWTDNSRKTLKEIGHPKEELDAVDATLSNFGLKVGSKAKAESVKE